MSESSELSRLVTLPTEIRHQILEYILPLGFSNKKEITIPIWQSMYSDNSLSPYGESGGISHLQTRHAYPSRHSIRRYLYGIGMTCRSLHIDTVYILHQRAFVLEICEDLISSRHDLIRRYVNEDVQWREILPGLDLSAVKEIRIHVALSGDPQGWSRVQQALQHFCSILDQRVGAGSFKRLVIDISGSRVSPEMTTWNDWTTPWSDLDPITLPTEDIITTLSSCYHFLRNAETCEVRVPGWAEGNEQVTSMVKETEEAICTRGEYPYKEEEDFCFPPLEDEYEEFFWDDYSGLDMVAQRRSYIWMKAPGEHWDDWYDMPKPAFDTEYDISDCAWMLAEEGVFEERWSERRYLDWQSPLCGSPGSDYTVAVVLRTQWTRPKPNRFRSIISKIKHAVRSPRKSWRPRTSWRHKHNPDEDGTASKGSVMEMPYWRDEEAGLEE